MTRDQVLAKTWTAYEPVLFVHPRTGETVELMLTGINWDLELVMVSGFDKGDNSVVEVPFSRIEIPALSAKRNVE